MSVRLDGNVIVLEGQCRVEDAEPLLGWLQADRERVVDLAEVEHLHAAVFQVLVALVPSIRGSGRSAFLRDRLIPILQSARQATADRTEG
jgi:anti-anti-sigma regulatory factor